MVLFVLASARSLSSEKTTLATALAMAVVDNAEVTVYLFCPPINISHRTITEDPITRDRILAPTLRSSNYYLLIKEIIHDHLLHCPNHHSHHDYS